MIRLYLKIFLLILPGFCFAQTKPIFQRTPDGPNIIADANLKVNKYLIVPISSISGIVGGSIDSAGYLRYNPITKAFQGYYGPTIGWTTIGGGSGSGGTVTTISINSANGISGSVSNPTTTPALTISLDSLNKWVTKTQLNLKANKYTTITINGVTQDLSANRTWTTGTITSITPGIGFASHTPITSSGTINLDTTTTIATKHTSIYTVKNLTLLKNYAGVATTISVSDTLRGGIFTYTTATLTPDSGMVFSATGKGSGYWKRVRENNNFYNARWYGAKGNDSNRDNVNIQYALDAAGKSGGGTVFLPKGIYRCYFISKPAYLQARLNMNYSNVTLEGEGRTSTRLKFLATNGLDPQTHWEIDSAYYGYGTSMRSAGLYIKSLATEVLTNIVIKGIFFDGGVTSTGIHTYPSNPTTGDGWDISHKGIVLYGDGITQTSNALIEDCEISNWRGENIWTGGISNIDARIVNCLLHDSNASMISGSFKEVSRCELYKGYNGLENYPGPQRGFYSHNYIHNNYGNGIVHGGSTADILDCRDFIISDNIIERNAIAGLFLTRDITHTLITNNKFTDNKQGGVSIDAQDKVVHDLTISNNTFNAIDSNLIAAILVTCNGNPCRNIHINGNIMETTVKGISNGVYMAYGIYYYGYGLDGYVYIEGNFFRGPQFLSKAATVTKNLIVHNNTTIITALYTNYVGNSYINDLPLEQVATTTIDPIDEVNYYFTYFHIVPLTLEVSTANKADRRKIINIDGGNAGTLKYKKSESNLSIIGDIIQPVNTSVTWEFNGTKWVVVEMVGAYYTNAPGNRSVSDASSVELSKSTLNTNYPTFVHNEVVFVPAANLKYIKMDDSTTGNWDEQTYNPAP